MWKWIATLFVFGAMMPGIAPATRDPTNDVAREREIYRLMIDRYAGKFPLCVVQRAVDFPHFIDGRRLSYHDAHWRYIDSDPPEWRTIDSDFSTLGRMLHGPIVGHYIPLELLPGNMNLTDPGGACSPKLELSAPAFVGQTAFIDLPYDCALCGLAATYALRRRDGHWEVAAEWVHWVS